VDTQWLGHHTLNTPAQTGGLFTERGVVHPSLEQAEIPPSSTLLTTRVLGWGRRVSDARVWVEAGAAGGHPPSPPRPACSKVTGRGAAGGASLTGLGGAWDATTGVMGSWGRQLTPLLLAAFCMSVSENAYRVVLPYHLLQLAGGADALQSAPLSVANHERLKVRAPLYPRPPAPWHLRSVQVTALGSACISRSAAMGFGVERRVPASGTAGWLTSGAERTSQYWTPTYTGSPSPPHFAPPDPVA